MPYDAQFFKYRKKMFRKSEKENVDKKRKCFCLYPAGGDVCNTIIASIAKYEAHTGFFLIFC